MYECPLKKKKIWRWEMAEMEGEARNSSVLGHSGGGTECWSCLIAMFTKKVELGGTELA